MARHDYISGLTSANAPNEKCYDIAAILYPDSMYDDWRDRLEAFEYPIAYCVHDKDHLADGELDRKVHVHVYIHVEHNTTLRYMKRLIETLCDQSKTYLDDQGKEHHVKECAKPTAKINNPRSKFEYLIHNTDKSRNKYQYDPKERIELNGFDIGDYEQISDSQKHDFLEEILDAIHEYNFYNLDQVREFYKSIADPSDDIPDRNAWAKYGPICQSYHAYISCYLKANFGGRVKSLEIENEDMKKKLYGSKVSDPCSLSDLRQKYSQDS